MTLRFSLEITAISSYIIEIAGRPIFTISLANSSSNLVLFTLFTLSLAVLL